MLKLILFISALLLSLVRATELEARVSELFEDYDIKKVMTKIVEDPESKNYLSSACFDTLQKYVNNFQSYGYELAMMTLYSGRDLNDLGRFSDCNALDFTRYISLSLRGLPIGIYLGICGPRECTEQDYAPLSEQLANVAKEVQKNIPDADLLQVNLTADSFQFNDSKARNAENTSISAGFIFTVCFFGFFIICCILGTLFEFKLEAIKAKRRLERERLRAMQDQTNDSSINGDAVIEEREDDVKPRGFLQKFLFSFAVYNNTNRLIFGRGAKQDKELDILNGIRVASISVVIIGHTFLYSLRGPVSNPLVMIQWFERWSFYILMAAPYSVDIFFWLSGFLGSYLMLELLKKRNGRNQPYWMIMLHRFLRIAPLYFATILFFWFIMAMAGTGPIFYMYKDDYAGACNRYWWSHLLFINNFYPFDRDEQCMGWTWYLPNDMQFFLLLPPLVYLLYRFRIVGIFVNLGIMLASFIVSFIILMIEDFSPSFYAIKENYYRVYYMKPYMRISPFIIGILLGLFVYSHRNDALEDSVIKRFCDRVQKSWIIRQLFYWVGIAILLVITFTFRPININPDDFNTVFNAFYMTLSKPLFVFAVVMVIFPVLLGRGVLIQKILGFDWFTPVARISFGAYLIHATYMLFEAFNRERATWSSVNNNITMFFAWWIVSFATSFLFTIIVETPCANLEKTFLMGGGGRGKKRREKAPVLKVPDVSFENSFSKGFIPKTEADKSPIKGRSTENGDDFWNNESPKNGNPFVKHSINS